MLLFHKKRGIKENEMLKNEIMGKNITKKSFLYEPTTMLRTYKKDSY
jgi:hypothetical protein